MLIIFSGLPAVGKTSVAKCLAKKIKATYLRIDTIENAISNAKLTIKEVGPAGYFVGYSVAKENLSLGLAVIADSTNLLQITREAWKNVAISSGVSFLEIELICSNREEHIRRVVSRENDIPGLHLPSWQEIIDREHEAWSREHITIDTSTTTIDEAVEIIIQYLGNNEYVSSKI